uniref:Uncharacterized protein n=1 Tax=Anopheles maculatus TaxID=74869 RepID=A0A182SU23_9DIPT
GGQRPLNDPIARPLTIQTDSILPGTAGNDGTAQGISNFRFRSGKLFATSSATSATIQPTPVGSSSTMDEFSMIVSPSLLTPSDMEIWRAIQQGQLDPKTMSSPSTVYDGTTGGHIPKSLSSTPTAHLSAELLGGDDLAGLGELDELAKGRAGGFRTIAASDDGALHQQGMLI